MGYVGSFVSNTKVDYIPYMEVTFCIQLFRNFLI